jgi:beta-aspartyl-peptidase (threonine type)
MAAMRTLWLFLPVVVVALAAQAGSRQPSFQNPSPTAQNQPQNTPQQGEEALEQFRAQAEEGIKHTLVSQIEAWNQGQIEGFMQGYWHSPDLTFFSGGTVTKGWEPTLQRYRQRYQGQGKQMGHLDFQDLNIDLVGRRAAVVTGKWQLTMSDGTTPHGLFTLIVKKMPAGWKIVHDHTSVAE